MIRGIIFWKRYINIEVITDFLAHDLLFEPRNESTASKDQLRILSCAAIKGHAIYGAGIVDDDHVFVFTNGSFFRQFVGRDVLSQVFEFMIDNCIRRRPLSLLYTQFAMVL